MATNLYELNLDLTKELNYTKAILARQGDIGLTVRVNLFKHGLPLTIKSTDIVTMKGTTPSGKYVDAKGIVTGNAIDFNLDGNFMSESGYYKNCYVEYNDGTHNLTTQDIIFFSLGVSDITSDQAKPYISRLEELINLYNETFDQFMNEITVKADGIKKQLDSMGTQATSLKTQLDNIQQQINELDLDTWKLEVLSESKAYSDSTSNKALADSKQYTDNTIENSLTTMRNELSLVKTDLTNVDNRLKLIENDVLPYEGFFSSGTNHQNTPTKARLTFGSEYHPYTPKQYAKMNPSPLTWNSGKWEATFNRDCVLMIEVDIKIQLATSSGTTYAYVTPWKDTNQTQKWVDGYGLGSSVALNYQNAVSRLFIIDAKVGDKFSLSVDMADGKRTVSMQMNGAHFKELSSV